jgi:hypothetical protein
MIFCYLLCHFHSTPSHAVAALKKMTIGHLLPQKIAVSAFNDEMFRLRGLSELIVQSPQ